jgi:ketosteroid isomerase-like protein
MNLEDRSAIADALARHGHVFDRGDLDRLDTVFTPDAVYDMSAVGMPVIRGIDALREGAVRMATRSPVAHHVTNVVVVSHGDEEARVESKGLMLMTDGSVLSVTHFDDVRRTAAGWRIARRVIEPQGAPLGGSSTTEAFA